MTHRGDSDWHGWPLQPIVEAVAQKRYGEMREKWPTGVRVNAPGLLTEMGRRDPDGNLVMRQITDGALASVLEVLDVVNQMPHPAVTEMRTTLAGFDITLSMPDQADDIAYADLVHDLRETVSRYTTTQEEWEVAREPLLDVLERVLSDYELSGEASPHRALAQVSAVVADYRENVQEV